MDTVEVRKAIEEDWDSILELVALYPEVLVQDHLPPVEEFFVAESEGTIVGCCALAVYTKRLAEIRSLSVAAEFQGRGIAKKLIKACIASAKEQGVHELLSITSSIELFGGFGFDTLKKEKLALMKVLDAD